MADQLPGIGGGRRDDQPGSLAGMLTFLILALIIAALYFGREVLVPLALAVLLSFLLAPAVHWLRHLRAGRVAAVAVTVLVAFLAIFAFAAVVTEEISLLGPELPEYRHNLELKLRALPKAIPLQRLAGALHQATAELKQSEAPAAKPAAAPGPSPGQRHGRTGQAAAGRDCAARADAARDRRDRDRPDAPAAGDGGPRHRAGDLHPARARGAARPGDQARRRRRSAPHDRGDERGGASGQPLSAFAALGQRRRGHFDRHRPGDNRHPERGAVGHPGDPAALHPLSRHRHRRLLSAGAGDRRRPRLVAAGLDGDCCSSPPSSSSPTWSSPGFMPAAPACPRSRSSSRRCSGPGCGVRSGCCCRHR